MIKKISIFILLFISVNILQAQNSADQGDNQLDLLIDSLFNDKDGDESLISFIDSLLKVQEEPSSELMLKFSYLSKISTLGRDMGLDQYGLSPGISYFHKSGLYSDVSAYWNSGDTLNMNSIMISFGFMKNLSKTYTINLSYDHSFYSEEGYSLTNSLCLSNYLTYNFFDIGFDYAYLFGSESAHRLSLDLSAYVPFKNVLIFDKIIVSPKTSVMFGTANVVNEQYNLDQIRQYAGIFGDRLTRRRRQIIRETLYEYYRAQNGTVFGLMNYNFSVPVKFKIDRFTISCNYSYNIPVSLPGENIDFPNYSYYSISTLYRIGL